MKDQFVKKYGVAALVTLIAGAAYSESQDRILVLEKQMAAAHAEIAALKGEKEDLSVLEEPVSRLSFGGYGEIHANIAESGSDQIDIHRLVMYVGYQFTDWIRLTSETELEHAYVNKDKGGGDLVIEQLYVDFLLSDALNVRAGRVLAPLGIINQHHEPTLFNGVERPNVEKYIIPSTWSLDGVGIFGYPLSWLSYEAYAVAGLDDTGFSAKEGIRGGRIKERQGLNDGALTGRIDIFPMASDEQDLRIGLSGYYGGTNNKNKGGDNTNNLDNVFTMISADFEYNIACLRFRGLAAHGSNSDADMLAAVGVGDEIFGWYLEAGASVMPEAWQHGRLADADIIPFVRYEEYDTQHELPGGASSTGEYERTDITVGANFLLTQDFVVKADIQFASNEASGSDTVVKYNLGMGWVFQ
ncbi:MAG: hypothetical protein HKP10_02700 [Kiritimatiellales bacterium]|nr:hypothetical protein [Pontiella sp.]NNJ70181.1 hypothetical protein [Kiritimatiellales bacterium]